MAELKSAKQEKFVQGLANGLSQRKAYRAAFPNSKKWKDSTVDVKACELAKDNKILVRLKELQEKATNTSVMTATKRKEWLSSLIESSEEETRDKLRAIDILNKMDGEYLNKIELSGEVRSEKLSDVLEQLGGEGLEE